MVNKERVALWVQALRDPDLIQGLEALATRENETCPWEQCCLDVACQVAKANGLPLTEVILTYQRGYNQGDDVEVHVLPHTVRDWYGFNETYVKLYHQGQATFATELNDDERLTFDQIADVIEQTYLRD